MHVIYTVVFRHSLKKFFFLTQYTTFYLKKPRKAKTVFVLIILPVQEAIYFLPII